MEFLFGQEHNVIDQLVNRNVSLTRTAGKANARLVCLQRAPEDISETSLTEHVGLTAIVVK